MSLGLVARAETGEGLAIAVMVQESGVKQRRQLLVAVLEELEVEERELVSEGDWMLLHFDWMD